MPTITHAEAIARAKKVAEVAAANAAAAEKLRRMPPENVKAMMDSDLVGLIIPKERGGYGIDSWMIVADVVAEVGRACGSSGWCFDLLIQHHWVFGMYPPEAQDMVYKADPRPKIGTSFMPVGKTTRAPGGFRLTGEWSFASGIDHCDWAIVGAPILPAEGSGPPDIRFFLLSRDQFTVRDTWNAVGLRGSGSNNIVANDVLVREEHTLRAEDFASGAAPGTKVNHGVMFREPGFIAFPFGIFCPLMGIARGAYDCFVEFARNRPPSMGRDPASALHGVQRAIGEAASEIDAAYLLAKDIDEQLRTSMPLGLPRTMALRRNFTLASRLALRAVDRLFEVAGARGIADSNPIQRFWRDMHAAANHVAWNVDGNYIGAGAHALGMPVPGMF
ncbi:MAG TPA: acyl-CoA dehydrogenase family protein [Stellaceae bacterium]|nr:acyl-CoA dehydrogenase family protein [Stellaceae bacterium]